MSESSDRLDLWLIAANAHEKAKKEIPLVVGVEIYEYLDQWVTIVRVNGDVGGCCDVTIETRTAGRTTVGLDELSLRKPRKST